MSAYAEFLKSKVPRSSGCGFDVAENEVNPLLKPHQQDVVRWAVKLGRAAIFEAFGLGKTLQQLEIARLILLKVAESRKQEELFPFCRFLIVAPLGVRQEFKRDAEMIGLTIKFVRRIEECEPTGLYLTNYETIRDGKMDPRQFTGVSLDEAGILRGFGGTKTFREFMRLFEGTAVFRFVATATPSPNEYIELLAYAAFLDVMDVGQAKTRFFKRDSTKADVLTLHPHKEREFLYWLTTWAIFLQSPADLGHDPTGYTLPDMEIHWHELPSDYTDAGVETNGQGRLVRNSAIGVTHAAREKRDSLESRIERLTEIVQRPRNQKSVVQEILSGEQGQIQGVESQAAQSQRIHEGVPQGVLPEEQREDQDSGQRALREEQRTVYRPIGQMAQSQPGTTSRGSTASCGEQPGEDTRAEPRMVFAEQRASGENEPQEQAEAIWPNRDGIHEHPNSPIGTMRDLPSRSEESQSGSRPHDGSGSRHSLLSMQRRFRIIPGSSGDATASERICDEQFIVWCEQNAEQRRVEESLAQIGVSFSSIAGQDSDEVKEARLIEWRDGATAGFIAKPVMYGAGVNLQQCDTAIFMGLTFKFAQFLQAIKRIHRFLQTRTVHIHIIYTEAEQEIRRALERKWEQHNALVERMSAMIREYGLASAAIHQALHRQLGIDRAEARGENFISVNNDSVPECAQLPENSVHLILTSIPFSTQYEYTPSFHDFGHTDDNPHFFRQMDFLTPNLLRILKPGRVAAIHVKDRIVPGGMTGLGFQTVYPFHCDVIYHFIKHGFAFLGMKTIVTDVVRENNQTYRLGWTEQCKDGSRMGFGMPEYLLLFRKPPTDPSKGYADEPVLKEKPVCICAQHVWDVTADGFGPCVVCGNQFGDWSPHDVPFNPKLGIKPGSGYSRFIWQTDAHGFMRSSGDRLLQPADLATLPHEKIFKVFREHSLWTVYNYQHDVALGESIEAAMRLPVTFMLLQPQSWHPDVWTDITRMLTLNGAQYAAGREMHLCPIQFDLADRVIRQFSMKGETVFDPFAGIGSVPYRAVLMGRKGHGIELSRNYWLDGVMYCRMAEEKMSAPTLFDMLEEEPAALPDETPNDPAIIV